MPWADARMLPAAVAAHSDPMTPKPMKRPYNSRARIVLDIALQTLFYAVVLGVFWLLSCMMP